MTWHSEFGMCLLDYTHMQLDLKLDLIHACDYSWKKVPYASCSVGRLSSKRMDMALLHFRNRASSDPKCMSDLPFIKILQQLWEIWGCA